MGFWEHRGRPFKRPGLGFSVSGLGFWFWEVPFAQQLVLATTLYIYINATSPDLKMTYRCPLNPKA